MKKKFSYPHQITVKLFKNVDIRRVRKPAKRVWKLLEPEVKRNEDRIGLRARRAAYCFKGPQVLRRCQVDETGTYALSTWNIYVPLFDCELLRIDPIVGHRDGQYR